MIGDLTNLELTDNQFETIRTRVYDLCGINLTLGKSGLVKARLLKRLRMQGLTDFDDYLHFVESDSTGRELTAMIDVLTTNKTSFFREAQHFDYIRKDVLPKLVAQGTPIRFWSAGCSTGEEPYTLAMVLKEDVPDVHRRDVRILATDISTSVLRTAQAGVYDEDRLRDVPDALASKYFQPVKGSEHRARQVCEDARKLVQFAHLNLMAPWPMRGPFDAIFCRNVMIYFDKPTQDRLIERFSQLLRPGGHLFVGHSESLTARTGSVRYVCPAVYVR